MKNHLMLVILLSFSLLSTTCGDDNFYTDIEPSLPDAINIDINKNGSTDFIIDYAYVDINAINSNFGLVGRIRAMGNNEILLKKQNPNLFLRNVSEVEETVSDPLYWNGQSADLVSIQNHTELGWPLTWDVQSTTILSSYFIGLKLKENNVVITDWIEIEVETNTGQIYLKE